MGNQGKIDQKLGDKMEIWIYKVLKSPDFVLLLLLLLFPHPLLWLLTTPYAGVTVMLCDVSLLSPVGLTSL